MRVHTRTQKAFWLASLLVIFLTLQAVIEPWAYAQTVQQQPARRANPQDYFIWEFLGGAFIGATSSRLVVEAILSSWCQDADDPEFCRRSGRVILRPLVYPLLVFVGTTAGIFTVGTLSGVEGNLLGAALGSLLGTLAGMVEAAAVWAGIDWLFQPGRAEELVSSPDTPPFLKRAVPLIIEFLRPYEGTLKEIAVVFFPVVTASYWGTMGFNSGARMRETPSE